MTYPEWFERIIPTLQEFPESRLRPTSDILVDRFKCLERTR